MTVAIEAWQSQVAAHHEQSARIQRGAGWSQNCDALAPHFVPTSADEKSPTLQRLFKEVDAGTTVLDVGGGAGRYALPLAASAASVTVVEPEESMANLLCRAARDAGIRNLFVIQSSWEDAEVQPAQTVLCAHVLHGISDVAAFICKLNAHATQRVLLLSFQRSPLAQFSPFWQSLYGEDRILQPGLPELLQVLRQLGISPELESIPGRRPDTVGSRDEALAVLRQVLFVNPGSETDRQLQHLAKDLLEVTRRGVGVRGAEPETEVLLSWTPATNTPKGERG